MELDERNEEISTHSSYSSTWICAECAYQNDFNASICRICNAKRSRKRSIDQLNMINHKRSKKRKMNDTLQNPDDIKSDDEMEQFYFPRNQSINKITIDNMDVFSFENTVKLHRPHKKEHHIINEIEIKEDDQELNECTDFVSNLSNPMFAYYSGEDVDALDFNISNYENNKIFELERKFFEWKRIYKG